MATMKLLGFRVTNFRSVEDSGWIDTSGITALIGTNESGKTNLLVPLWKLNPAKDGEINPLSDFPRKKYNEYRLLEGEKSPVFIEASFELDDSLAQEISDISGAPASEVSTAVVKRRFDGKYLITFPNANLVISVRKNEVEEVLASAKSDILSMQPATKAEEPHKDKILEVLDAIIENLSLCAEDIYSTRLKEIQSDLATIGTETKSQRSTIMPRFLQAVDSINDLVAAASRPSPSDISEARQKVLRNIPKIVYYSNYGNLDSEIYLPHVIENLKRKNLGSKEEAKVRTLKVLFEFVRLKPDEILELGKDLPVSTTKPTEEEIKVIAENKKEREVLLQSASTDLTGKFKNWWKQGDYRFRFQADGDHFRIWVSDDRRPEEIELEGRSTGLQWFLSFYLIFLVESEDTHDNSILLLDEPGLSLHPLAQKDLSAFFDNLSQSNQILYTTHSPFLVNANNLDQVKAVYVNELGTTEVSSNLRASENIPAQSKSIYPVHAALGLSVSDTLLQGCQPIIVEGSSDQLYLSAMKGVLISLGRLSPKREMIFIPAGGVRGVPPVVAIVTGKDEELPFVLIDADSSGRNLHNSLSSNTYKGKENRVVSVKDYVDVADGEIEDLLPGDFLAKIVDRMLRSADIEEDFSESLDEASPFVSQVESYANKYKLPLKKGWKVELAAQAKIRLVKNPKIVKDARLEQWVQLFSLLDS